MIEERFHQAFGKAPAQVATAPGRVNLIGEHIDYNGGVVLPTALPVSLAVGLRPRSDNTIRIASGRFENLAVRTIGAPKHADWADYAVGAVQFACAVGFLDGGADILIESTIPDGAGLSSSAALIVAVLKAARNASTSTATDKEIAILARRVENEYIAMPCGIMDQMAVAVAKPGEAIALDTKSLSYDIIALPADFHMAVVHSGQQRKLSDGRYAERKIECDDAKDFFGTMDLCLLSDQAFADASDLPEKLNKRVRHCISEHRRTLAAADALQIRNMQKFGELMNESHVSMRDDFEMTTPVIDALVADAVKFGAIGARLTGGGFGGCIVACVAGDDLDNWKKRLLAANPDAKFIC